MHRLMPMLLMGLLMGKGVATGGIHHVSFHLRSHLHGASLSTRLKQRVRWDEMG